MRPKYPKQATSPMAADTVGETPTPAAVGGSATPPGVAQAATPMPAAPAAPARPALAQKTHNPDNLLPAHAFHGKKR